MIITGTEQYAELFLFSQIARNGKQGEQFYGSTCDRSAQRACHHKPLISIYLQCILRSSKCKATISTGHPVANLMALSAQGRDRGMA